MNNNYSQKPKITKFHHVTIEVNDIEEAFHFYTKILGFDEQQTPVDIKEIWTVDGVPGEVNLKNQKHRSSLTWQFRWMMLNNGKNI